MTSWHGQLDLTYHRRGETTQLLRSSMKAPLKVQRSFYPEGGAVCHNVTLHTAGGMVGGDRLSQMVRLETGAAALITTAAASKVYRSNGLEAQQTIHLEVAADACLEWLPQETIVFDGAVYRQDLRVDLAVGASWLGWDIVRLGRTARGEKFTRGMWRSNTEIWRGGVPLWIDRQRLPASEVIFQSPHGLAGMPIVATLLWAGEPVSSETVDKARLLWNGYDGEVGVTRLVEGLICRYRGQSTDEVRNWFTAVWDLLRPSYLGRAACPPRVWPI